MKRSVTDYLREYRKQNGLIPVSPIWGGEKLFPFLCLDHRTLAEMLGFEVVQATPVLSAVREGQLDTAEETDAFIKTGHGKSYRGSDFAELVIQKEITWLRQMKDNEPEKWTGGGCFGPLTVLSGIVGIEKLLRMIVRDPDRVISMLGIVTEMMKGLALREAEAGMDFFWIAEPLASVIAPRSFWQFSGKWIKEIFDTAGTPGFLHVCGNTDRHTEELLRSGAEVLSIDYVTDISLCMDTVPDSVVVMGNVSPVLLRYGSAEEVRAETAAIIDAVSGRSNFILSTGCSIIDGTPDDNMKVLFEHF